MNWVKDLKYPKDLVIGHVVSSKNEEGQLTSYVFIKNSNTSFTLLKESHIKGCFLEHSRWSGYALMDAAEQAIEIMKKEAE